ncbi:hypothetical protein [Microbaculum marinum]|uniref:Uncharacterized protein n=1 Tax=Microbaculum marinum TaxID=1764581 RepID=A0AAW9RRA5_9HYPH
MNQSKHVPFMSRFARVALLGAVAATGLLCGPPSAEAKVPATLIQQRAIAMQGLSIGLGLLTLTSQVNAVIGSVFLQAGECVPLVERGSMKVISAEAVDGTVVSHVQIYFDKSCSALHLDEHLEATPIGETFTFDADVEVHSRAGNPVGTYTLKKNTLTTVKKTSVIYGAARFKAHGNGPVVYLGLNCELPDTSFFAGLEAPKAQPVSIDGTAARNRFDCVGVSAQRFDDIGKSLAARTEIILKRKKSGRIGFLQTEPGETMIGAPGSLSVKVTKKGKVKVAGKAKPWSTNDLSGQINDLVVYPSQPSGWTIVDGPRRSEFALDYRKKGKKVFHGAVYSKNGTPLAPFTLDASGSGKIRYSDGVKATVSSWTLTR